MRWITLVSLLSLPLLSFGYCKISVSASNINVQNASDLAAYSPLSEIRFIEGDKALGHSLIQGESRVGLKDEFVVYNSDWYESETSPPKFIYLDFVLGVPGGVSMILGYSAYVPLIRTIKVFNDSTDLETSYQRAHKIVKRGWEIGRWVTVPYQFGDADEKLITLNLNWSYSYGCYN